MSSFLLFNPILYNLRMEYIIGIDEVGRAATKRRASPKSYVIGIDEVGRGPLAGPVTVCALALPINQRLTTNDARLILRDSKKLSPKQREKWLEWIKRQKIAYSISSVSPKIIDKINISQAANLAATRCVKKLLSDNKLQTTNKKIKIFLDGGLHINTKTLKNLSAGWRTETVIKGDEKIPAISLASIIAKVHRDKLMEKNNKNYPGYGFEKHKGYGTKLHYKMIKKYGISDIHRKTFLKNYCG